MAQLDLTGLLGIETPQARSQRLLEEGAKMQQAVATGSPAAVAAMNLPTAQATMRGSVGRLFGIDTRTPTEKLQEQLAGVDLSTSSGLTRASKLARDLGLSAQAVVLATQAGATRQQEEDRDLRRQREQQIIDLAPRTEERAEETLALNRAKFAAEQAAQTRQLGLSEERRAASQNAFLSLYGPEKEGEDADPRVTEIAQAIGTGALTLAEGQSIMTAKDPSNVNDFYAWQEDNQGGTWTEFMEWEASLKTRPTTTQGTTLDRQEREEVNNYIDSQLSTGMLDRGEIDLPEGANIDVIKNKVQKLMEADKTIDMESGLAIVLKEYGIGQQPIQEPLDPALEESLSAVSETAEPSPTQSSTQLSDQPPSTSAKPKRGTAGAMNRGPRTPTVTTSILPAPAGGRSGRGFPYRN